MSPFPNTQHHYLLANQTQACWQGPVLPNAGEQVERTLGETTSRVSLRGKGGWIMYVRTVRKVDWSTRVCRQMWSDTLIHSVTSTLPSPPTSLVQHTHCTHQVVFAVARCCPFIDSGVAVTAQLQVLFIKLRQTMELHTYVHTFTDRQTDRQRQGEQ